MNNIAQRIYSHLLINNKIDSDYTTIENFKNILNNNPEKFFFFNDDYFWEKIQDIIKENNGDLVYKLANSLIKRTFPDIKDDTFFSNNFKSEILVNYSQILSNNTKFKNGLDEFNKKISQFNKDGQKYFGVCIEKSIAPEAIAKEYQDDKQINIIVQKNNCKNIMDLKNQFFQLFLFDNQAENNDGKNNNIKELKSFKVYDFNKILN